MPTESEIFFAAKELPLDERAAFLEKTCGTNLELRKQVEVMLSFEDRENDSWVTVANRDTQTPNVHTKILESDSAVNSIGEFGSEVGSFRLVKEIGKGGMGTVWLANQAVPIVRQVALKFIKPEHSSAGILARFEAERQALAMMNHPNIAGIIDAGTTENGQPYFAMEYVDGDTLMEYCDQNRLTVEQRLQLFSQVCDGVQHAHQKGVIHRDLKPSNILVRLE